MKRIKTILLCFILSGCNKDIIHYENIEKVDTFTISEVTSPPWIKIILTNTPTKEEVVVHLQKHCYSYKQIPIGLKFAVTKTKVTYEDYSTEIKLYPDYDQTQNIIEKYCN